MTREARAVNHFIDAGLRKVVTEEASDSMNSATTSTSRLATVTPLPVRRRVQRALRLVCIAATACVVVAIVIQDHTSYLPLGVFNTGAKTLSRLADALLILALLALVAQIVETFTGRLARACGVIRGVIAFVCILNVLLIFGDRLFVTGNPAGLLGQYYEVPSSGREPVILKKDFSGRTPDPCLAPVDPAGGPRVLFLGDSYTEGSGRERACNYPDVVEATLRERGVSNARVVNAGVSGYGPVEALNLLRWHRAKNCPIDAIVYNLVLENDFADNLPRTERRVVAGIISRFPRSWFLRTFHPLDMRTFRWAMILTFFARASTKEMLNAVTVADGPCNLEPEPLTEVSPFLRDTVERSLASAHRLDSVGGTRDDVVVAIAGMRDIAQELGVPFVLVVFPDRALVDVELQRVMPIETARLAPAIAGYHFAMETLPADLMLDMSETLTGAGLYREADTHLSDLGNVVAGRFVGNELARRLAR